MRSPPARSPAARARVIGFFDAAELAEHGLEELLLAQHPAEVAGGVGHLLAVDHLDVVAGAHERRAPAAPSSSTGPASLHVEAGVAVERRVREVDRDAAQRVDELGEADEVDLEVVVDRDAERLLHGEDQPARAAVVGGVDLLRAVGLGDRHVEVARDRHHHRLAVHEPEQQHRVGSLAAAVGEAGRVEPGVDEVLDVARVGADDQVVGAARRPCSARRPAGSSRSCRRPTWRRGSRPAAASEDEQREQRRAVILQDPAQPRRRAAVFGGAGAGRGGGGSARRRGGPGAACGRGAGAVRANTDAPGAAARRRPARVGARRRGSRPRSSSGAGMWTLRSSRRGGSVRRHGTARALLRWRSASIDVRRRAADGSEPERPGSGASGSSCREAEFMQ